MQPCRTAGRHYRKVVMVVCVCVWGGGGGGGGGEERGLEGRGGEGREEERWICSLVPRPSSLCPQKKIRERKAWYNLSRD